MSVPRILAVCLGNICRSPMAEGLLKHKAMTLNTQVDVDSAGTSNLHEGEQPDKRAINEMKARGIDISNQRSRPFMVGDFNKFDHILVMDVSNRANVLKLARNNADRKKVELILNFGFPNQDLSVPDPYYDNAFGQVFELLDKSCEVFLFSLKNSLAK